MARRSIVEPLTADHRLSQVPGPKGSTKNNQSFRIIVHAHVLGDFAFLCTPYSLFFLWEIITAGMILLDAQPQPCFVRN